MADILVRLSLALWLLIAILDDFSSFNNVTTKPPKSNRISAEASSNSEGI